MMAPAPPAAMASCGRERSSVTGTALTERTTLCSSLYARNSDAFSAMAPTIGAGRPCCIAFSHEHDIRRGKKARGTELDSEMQVDLPGIIPSLLRFCRSAQGSLPGPGTVLWHQALALVSVLW